MTQRVEHLWYGCHDGLVEVEQPAERGAALGDGHVAGQVRDVDDVPSPLLDPGVVEVGTELPHRDIEVVTEQLVNCGTYEVRQKQAVVGEDRDVLAPCVADRELP